MAIDKLNNKNNTKVYVGLSGGVDSSVTAALLLQQGYQVVGVFMKNWTRDIAGHRCPWEDDLLSAKRVAAELNIDLKVFDLQSEYKANVVDAMIAAYQAGLTPNPDILCNQDIKFQLFYDLCRANGADLIATGHYARMINGRLAMAEDDKKDQTYFLYRMPPKNAESVLFPLGEYKKPQVREMATEFGLSTATRRDSMGLCFVGRIPLKDFLSELAVLHPGQIVSESGELIGQHDGVELFTIGQRHGLGVGGGQPYYVLHKDMDNFEITVTTNPTQLQRDNYLIGDTIWWEEPDADRSQPYMVRIRHLGELLPCHLTKQKSGNWLIKLLGNHRGVAAGQHAVIYDGQFVLGGGPLI